MTSVPVCPAARPSALPDYYADERQARRRVRLRHAARWLGLAAAGALLVWRAGR